MAFFTSGRDILHDSIAWYESANPLRVDLVGDLAGKELFVIHGDALMLYCIVKANVDLQDGFQLLHAVHAVESFLYKLKERDCNFHIVWIRDHENFCLPRGICNEIQSQYLLTRAILIQHLRRQQVDRVSKSPDESQAVCFEFHSLDDVDFEKYLNLNAIRFFLCLDGLAFNACTKPSAAAYLSIAHHLAARGYSLAFINDIEIASSAVRSSVVSPTSSRQLRAIVLPVRSTTSNHETCTPLYNSVQLATKDWSPWEDSQALSAREWSSVHALCVMANMLQGEPREFHAWSSAFITHLVLLRRLPLSQRSFDVVQTPHDIPAKTLLSKFSSICLGFLASLPRDLNWDLFDLLDGRLLRYVLLKDLRLPTPLITEAHKFAAKITQVTGIDISGDLPSFDTTITSTIACLYIHNDTPIAPAIRSIRQEYSVLPFGHSILDDYLQDIRLTPTSVSEKKTLPRIFKELSHWHNARVSVDIKHVSLPKTPSQMRMYHKLMAATIVYSASLTNASGRMIEPEVLIVAAKPGNQPGIKNLKYAPTTESKMPGNKSAIVKESKRTGVKKGHKKSGKEAAFEATQALQEKKARARANDAMGSWEQQCMSLEKEPDLIKRYLKTIKYLDGLSDSLKYAVGIDASLYACNVLASMLIRHGPRPSKKDEISALIWSTIQGIRKSDLVSASATKLFNSFVEALQLPADFVCSTPASENRLLPFTNVFDSRGNKPDLSPGNIEFQLQHCGPFLERSFDPAPDPRVPFSPDAWQRNVLDAIDAAKSLFVVAPTSAGKTFISFYAMKRILQGSNDGVLVYVAPTKALVNQIAAEIQARYTKKYGHEARSVWAIHTRDYRVNNPGTCQVLVTVPHILQIMLMAPSNAENPNSWSRRVKRIIFDEVHCIGQADDGIIWEQLLLLAPCPIIALSATVGNPLEFKAWLEETERVKGNELEMIVHSTRYSDLRKFMWHAPEGFVFNGLQPVKRLPVPGLDDGGDAASRFFHIHPVASLINRNRGTIQDLSLEPRDCLSLWNSMSEHQTSEYTINPRLRPQKALPAIVRKVDVAKYEIMLKDELESWMENPKSPFETVRKDLQPRCQVSPMSYAALKTQVLPLLVDLRSQGALPAIFFNYDRVSCEDFAFRILEDLTQAEEAFKASDPEWKKKMAKFEEWKKVAEKSGTVKKKSKSKSKKKQDEDDTDDERLQEDPSIWVAFDPDAPLSQFSFADETKFSSLELEETVKALRYKEVSPNIIAALRRGIGVHHAGMNRKYRQTVEMLFRKGFLTVAFATGTLALGLNMPCKTVVFFGDSVFLTALNYHQAAGRAGRRGFDLLGNVVFVGMSKERVFEIMSSRLPDLRGHFPLSTTLVLRTLGLMHHTKNSDYSVRAVQSLLSQTRLYLGGPADQMAIKHHLRFSIEYLRRQHLLDRDGVPLNFAGLVGHLYFTEDAVFAFHSLLKEGYFHTLCARFHREPDDVLLTVVLVLSHIFCRISTGGFRSGRREVVRKSPSMVFLPPLPDDALRVLRQHNRDTLDIFKSYVGTFVEQHLRDKSDRCLPFTKFEVGASDDKLRDADLLDILTDEGHLAPTKLRSPFDALSGFDDHSFSSIHELCSTIRSGVFLEESAIPFIPIYPDDTEGVPWNAYIYDFFKHGDIEALVRDNHIKRGDVWFRLKDFSLILATIVTSLTNFLDLIAGGDADLAMMDVQDAKDAYQENLDAVDVDDSLTAEIQAAQAAKDGGFDAKTADHVTLKKPKEVKVADSWEEDDDDDVEGELEAATNSSDSQPKSQLLGASGGTTESVVPPAWEGAGERNMLHVLRIFKLVQQNFDEKFRKIWA